MGKRNNWDGVSFSTKQAAHSFGRGGGRLQLCILCGRIPRSREVLADLQALADGKAHVVASFGMPRYGRG